MHPSVLKALVHIVEGAHRVNRPVSICGEMAGNPLASILLLGMGVDSLSMSAGSLLRVKWVIRSISRKKARRLLKAALKLEDSRQVRQIMQKALEKMGLGRLVRLGR
jgi:phosphotransferase system enzyme I (PtsP)